MKNFIMILMAIMLFSTGGYLLFDEMAARPAVTEVYQSLDIVNGKIAYMTFDEVGSGTYDDMRENLLYIQTMGIKDVHLTMCNPGGHIVEMWAIYDMLYQATMSGSINLTTHAQGFIASAAVPIYLLGQVRTIGYNGHIMIHPHSGTLSEYNANTENDMLEQWTQRWIDVLEDRTNMSRSKLLLHMSAGLSQKMDAFYMNAEIAKDYGFVTKII